MDWERLVKESCLNVVSVHQDLGSIERNCEAVAAEAKRFGTDTVVITGMYRFDYGSEEAVRELARRLNAAGKALAQEGIRLLYHNHNCELRKVNADKCAYDLLLAETDENRVSFSFSYVSYDSTHVGMMV